MSAFTSAAQGDSCRATKKFLQTSKDLPFLDAEIMKSALAKWDRQTPQALYRQRSTWPSGDPGTNYDNTATPRSLWAPGSSS